MPSAEGLQNRTFLDMLTQQDYAGIVESEIRRLQLPAAPAGLYEPIRYALDCGGKRLHMVCADGFVYGNASGVGRNASARC